jgi:hypothetical protein
MGFIYPDIARSTEDFEECLKLQQRLNSAGVIPPFGQPGNLTYVIRDADDRATLHGMIHTETAVEVRSFLVDPAYPHSRVSMTILQHGMEMNLRANGVKRYYFTVPTADKRVISIFEKDGAGRIDDDMVRFMKVL